MHPLVADMLEATLRPDIEIDFQEALNEVTPCEAYRSHPIGAFGHVTSQGASFLGIYPCGLIVAYCAGFVHHGAAGNFPNGISCSAENGGCHSYHLWPSITFLPLDFATH